MAGGYHNAAVGIQSAVGKIALRRGTQSEIDHIRSLFHQAAADPPEEIFGMGTHIPADDHFARAGELHISSADSVSDILIDFGWKDSPDIVCFENS